MIKSAIARAKRFGWNTVERWLDQSAACCRRFNQERMRPLKIHELQADEIRTVVGGKEQSVWIFNAIEVRSRAWAWTIVGRRDYRNTRSLLRDVRGWSQRDNCPLIVTDGFESYERVLREVFGPTCLHGQDMKTRRDGRVTKVERELIRGARWRLERALSESEDSSTLNTSFVERLNLTIRQSSAPLARRSLCHSRWRARLEDHLKLLRCHYNFVRPHRALEFGKEARTLAMHADLAKTRLTLRDILCSGTRTAYALV